ncbi:MAG TPA: trypsin-like peptidase domain-containing protein [Gaiellaceae bacterium]|nr:trypsin-like peptidase domain-containing protein [Gaiellaceae bacterium]
MRMITRGEGVAVLVAAVIAGAVAGGLAGWVLDNDSPAPTAVAPAPNQVHTIGAPSRSPEAIYRDASRGVVVITDQQTQVVPPTLFAPGRRQQVGALGSGFVVDRRGDIVTNDHVVQGATNIRVAFSGSESYPAETVGTDPSSDLAVIRVSAPPAALQPLAFADSSSVQVGDPVYAIGNPFGLDRTMTAGIVSATGRDIKAPNGLTIPNAVQTDAAINHGNSGGPLLDRFGRVIGVNAQIEGGTVDANVGVGFAIPSSTTRSIADQLIATGRVRHPWLGVQIETIDPLAENLSPGFPKKGVLVVAVVKGGPAARAGLEPARPRVIKGVSALVGGDVIVAIDRKSVASAAQLSELVAMHKSGDAVRLEVVRRGQRRTVAVALGDAPA